MLYSIRIYEFKLCTQIVSVKLYSFALLENQKKLLFINKCQTCYLIEDLYFQE